VSLPGEVLDRYLASWRQDSLRPPDIAARERARAALQRAVAAFDPADVPVRVPRRFAFRPRHRALRLAGALAVAGAAAAVATSGWNAPAGSPLHGVRTARQGVQLALPGANLAALHLDFAAQSLADARLGIAPAASLAEAGAELEAALRDLPVDHSSPLWSRWNQDEEQLASERAAYLSTPAQPGGGALRATEPADRGATSEPAEAPGGTGPPVLTQPSPAASPGKGDE
jgi:hypothetical protein